MVPSLGYNRARAPVSNRGESKRKLRDDEARWFKKLDQDPLGDLDELKKFSMDRGVSVNVLDENYENGLLRISGRHGNAHKVSWLITHGADATLTDSNGLQALHRACSAVPGSRDNVQLLLTAKDVSANTRAEEGKTPLMYAARRGRTEAIKVLLSRGADVTLVDERGWTAFHHLCACGVADAQEVIAGLQLLLSAGSNINFEQGGGTPLVVAYESRGLDDVVEWIVDKDGDSYTRTRDGQPVSCEPSPALGDLIERKRRAKRMLAALAKAPPSETFTVNFPSSRRGSADEQSSTRRNSLGLGGSTGSLSQALAAIQSSPSNANSSKDGNMSKSGSGRDLSNLSNVISPPGSDRGGRTLSSQRAATGGSSYLSPPPPEGSPSSSSTTILASPTPTSSLTSSLSAARAAALNSLNSPPGSNIPRPRTPSITPPTPSMALPAPSGSGSTSPPARSSAASQARRDSRKKRTQTMPSGTAGLAGLAAVLETDRPDWEQRIRERIDAKRNDDSNGTTNGNGVGRRKDSDDPFEALATRAPASSVAAPPSSLAASLSASQSFLSASFNPNAGVGSMMSAANSVTNPSYLLATSPSDNDPFGMASRTNSSSNASALHRSRSPQRTVTFSSTSSSTFDPFSNSPPPTAASSLALGTSPPPLAASPPAAVFDLFGSSPQQTTMSAMSSMMMMPQRHASGSIGGNSAQSQGFPSSMPMAMPPPNRHHHSTGAPTTTSTPNGYYGQHHMLPNTGGYGGMPMGGSHGGNVSMFDPFFSSPPNASSGMLPPTSPHGGLHHSIAMAPGNGAAYGIMNSPYHSPSPYSHTPSPATPTPSPGMMVYNRATSLPMGPSSTQAVGNGMGVLPMSMVRTSSAPAVTNSDPFSNINPFATVVPSAPAATTTGAPSPSVRSGWQPF